MAKGDSEAAEGGDDGAEGDAADEVEEEIAEVEMDITEDMFVKYKVAQKHSPTPTDYVAIAAQAGIENAEAEWIMLHDKSLSEKYSQALTAALAAKGKGKAPTTDLGPRAAVKPKRTLIRKSEE